MRIAEIIRSRKVASIDPVSGMNSFFGFLRRLVMCRFLQVVRMLFIFSPGFWVRTCPGSAASCLYTPFQPNLGIEPGESSMLAHSANFYGLQTDPSGPAEPPCESDTSPPVA